MPLVDHVSTKSWELQSVVVSKASIARLTLSDFLRQLVKRATTISLLSLSSVSKELMDNRAVEETN